MTKALWRILSDRRESMRSFKFTLSAKFGIVFLIIFFLAVTNVIGVRAMLGNLDGVADTINSAGRLRMLSQKIALETIKAIQDQGQEKPELQSILREFELTLSRLEQGQSTFGAGKLKSAPEIPSALEAVRRDWLSYREQIALSLNNTRAGAKLESEMPRVTSAAAPLLANAERLVSVLSLSHKQTQQRALFEMYVLLLLNAVVFTLIFFAVRKQIIRPLREIAGFGKDLAKGNYQAKIDYRSHDEIGLLADAFTHSAQRIGELIAHVEKDRQNILQAESMFRNLADNSMVGVYIAQAGAFRFVNPKMADMFQYQPAEMVSNVGIFDLVTDEERPTVEENMQQRLTGALREANYIRQGRRKDGSIFDVEVFGSRMDIDGLPATIGIMLDITERKRIDRALRVLIACNQALVHATDESALLAEVCRIVHQVGGYPFVWTGYVDTGTSKKILPVAAAEDVPGALRPMIDEISWDEVAAGRGITGTAIRTGQTVIVQAIQEQRAFAPWHDFLAGNAIMCGMALPLMSGNKVLGSLSLYSQDANTFTPDEVKIMEELADNLAYGITALRADAARMRYAQQLEFNASHDSLTGLVNRICLGDLLQNAIASASVSGQMVAVLLLDLDDFKEINERLGHPAGDALLKSVAARLCSCVREGDTVARLGADEFVMVLCGLDAEEQATEIAHQVLDLLSQPLSFENQDLYVSSSIAVSLYPQDGGDGEILLKNVELVMYRAKKSGRASFHFYTDDIKFHNRERRALEGELHHALRRDELRVHYQPKVDMRTGEIVGVEALARWEHPDRGMIPPVKFIPMAEDAGLIIPLGTWVMRTACAQNKAWQDAGLPPVSVAVNLSARQFRHHDLVGLVRQVLEQTGLDPQYLELELTESVIMQEAEEAVTTLLGLKALGVQLSLDDFGTGYSSLTYLRRFPLDKLKIDRSFVAGITSNSYDSTIVKAVIALAHSLNLKVVAEGVEQEAELAFLRAQDCDEIQGYYYSRPVVPEVLSLLLQKGGFPAPDLLRLA
ncbi:hypothetical protein BH11PSE11_BH11PSE11_12990 [soil metagenome]